ncbi:unnamed protein product [Aureobasidium vineae]|uniref:N-alpha-acetyltransferase 40 n=1 Tax=Aureobasidium vineae TaxID=2773715 RepID=A0A9N8P6K6_9PEZI|nr:unnamed protein product [Aureobasidium vineae]
MSSAATERKINKWRLWGVNKFLEVNTALSPKQERNGEPPTLGLVRSLYHEDEKEATELLQEARSSLKEMDMTWVIFGACEFLNEYPLRTSKENGSVLLKHSDVFRTFGKKASQGTKLYTKAGEAYLRFRKIRDLNTLPMPLFAKDYLPAGWMEYTSYRSSVSQRLESKTGASLPMFDILMFTSFDLFERVNAETIEPTKPIPIVSRTLFELIKRTSYTDYNASEQGWSDSKKLDEMKDEDMRYLIVRLKGGRSPAPEKQWSENLELDSSIIGFLSFMITEEEEENVAYIYEIHISEHFRDCGLGRHLFSLVEHIGRATGMDKTMLTIFTCNTHARRWYDSRVYEVDEISPRPRKLRGGRSIEPEYEILSKRLQEHANKKTKS